MNSFLLFRENTRISVNSIKSNRLRTTLTIFIIALGIMALVGILTAIDSIQSSITEEFSNMGANTLTIESRGTNIRIGSEQTRTRNYSYISYRQAREFKNRFDFPSIVSVWTNATGTGTIKYENNKTNPNISVRGTDENYLVTSGYEIETGRNFSASEIEQNRSVAVIGNEIATQLFDNTMAALEKVISVGSGKYRVIGVLKEKGSSAGGSGDKIVLLPYTNVRQYFSRPNRSYSINISVFDSQLLDAARGEAEGAFRIVRNLDVKDESDFNITSSDSLANMLIENTSMVTLAATIIGIITLLGAAIGLMNIMLVSVTERTREIGIRKAIGAKSKMIKQQFLFEAVIIGQLGGLFGIILGILIGNIVSLITNSPFVIPWLWILLGIGLCFIVGIASGYFPAVKASKLDPIESLRYE